MRKFHWIVWHATVESHLNYIHDFKSKMDRSILKSRRKIVEEYLEEEIIRSKMKEIKLSDKIGIVFDLNMLENPNKALRHIVENGPDNSATYYTKP